MGQISDRIVTIAAALRSTNALRGRELESVACQVMMLEEEVTRLRDPSYAAAMLQATPEPPQVGTPG